MLPIIRNNAVLIGLALAVCLLIIHHLLGFFGHFGFDDVRGYAFYAHKWIHTSAFYLDDDFFSYRWGIIAPLALVYSIFGIHDLSSAIPAGLFFLGHLYLLLSLNKDRSIIVLFFVFFLYCFDNWTLYYSDKIMPDIAVSFCILLSVYSIYRLRFGDWTPNRASVVFSLSVCYGFLCKMSIFLVFPLYIFLMIEDLMQRNALRFWIQSLFTGLIFLFMYLFCVYYITGSPTSRWDSTLAGQDRILGSTFRHCAYYEQSWSALFYRLSGGFYSMLFQSGQLFSLVLVLPIFFQRKWLSSMRRKGSIFFWVKVFAILLLCANGMTTSLLHYNPMCLDIRQYLFLVPFSAILGAHYLSQIYNGLDFTKQWWLIPAFLLLSILIRDAGNIKWLYVCLILFLMGIRFSTSFKKVRPVLLFLFIPLSAMLSVSNMISSRKFGYDDQKRAISYLGDQVKSSLVYTDEVQANIATYLMAFNKDHVRYIFKMDSFDSLGHEYEQKWLFINRTSQSMAVYQDKNYSLNSIADSLINQGVRPINFNLIELYDLSDN